jgi:hypothetical protein
MCQIHHSSTINSNHRIVETVREWNPVNKPIKESTKKWKIPTNLLPDEQNMFNKDIKDNLQHEEFMLDGNPSEEDIDRAT